LPAEISGNDVVTDAAVSARAPLTIRMTIASRTTRVGPWRITSATTGSRNRVIEGQRTVYLVER
jgi:hypothetical protein